jgi:TMAO reductase system sensor TorS
MITETLKLRHGFRDASIRIKLILIISLSVLIALLIVATAITCYEYNSRKQHTADDLSSIADIISWNSSAALAFMDVKTAGQTLQVLETQPGKVAAFLYTPDGLTFADYKTTYKTNQQLTGVQVLRLVSDDLTRADNNQATRPFYQTIWQWCKEHLGFASKRFLQAGYSEVIQYDPYGQIHLLRPIFIDNELVGVLHLVDDQREINAFFANFYLIIGAIVLITLIATLLVSTRLQRIFSVPLLDLMQAMRKVANEKKFTSKVSKASNDEFGQLVDVYNDMLKEVHHRDRQLDKYRESLEIQVKERTQELTATNHALQLAVTEALTAKEEAEAANHAKSQFLANMSHEIRTPMNAVLGMTDFLYESELNRDQRHSIEIVQQSARLLLGVINDILDFSKIESGKLELDAHSFNFQELINNSFAMLETQAKAKGLQYRLDVHDVPAILEGDSVRLSQILMNLLSNAVKFTTRGEVVLRAYSQPLNNDAIRLFCEVSDTGIGVSADKQALIFDAFSQADNSMTRAFGGTGLGLAIAKQLVRLMGGEIGINSQPGNGATFWFWVNLQKSDAVAETIKVLPNCRFTASILVAEDYPANQILVKRFLEGFGCQVYMVNNGLEALEAIKQQRYDLVLMDCQMPIMDGYKASEKIRRFEAMSASARRLPIIALTAHALAGDRAKCLSAGMDEWVTKPFTRQDLNAVLQKWLPDTLIIPESSAAVVNPKRMGSEQLLTETAAVDIHFLQQNFNFDDPDDVEFIVSLKEAFQQNAEQSLAGLRRSIEQDNAEQVRKLAHGLKSISANVGGMQLSGLCKALEELGRLEQLESSAELLNAMQAEYARVLLALNSLCSKDCALVAS